jgi:hypothetical protein
MSTLEADLLQASTGTDTALLLKGKGTGVVKLGDAELAVPDADAAAGQILTTNGSAALTFAATPGTSGNVLTSNGSAWTSSAGGKMLQVVSLTVTTQTDTTSASYADVVGMNQAITPSASSSKILILVSIAVTATSANGVGEFKIVRNITGGAVTDLNVFSQINHVEHQSGNHFLMQLDSPSTTASTAYYLQFFRTDQSGTVTVNRNDGSDIARSVITLIEVGA